MGLRGVGTIYQMDLSSGSLYFQHVGWDATFGDVIAVYADAALSDYKFSVLFPIGSANKQKIIDRVGRAEVPARYQPLRFRYPLGTHEIGARWMIVENGLQRQVDRLSPEQATFVLAFAVNDTALAELFRSGWVEGEPFPLLNPQPS